ncbi:hypothetical protein [Clostridium thermobutyricum]|uniref:hypothetical protein n=1 Tax=Clostridium thermobutyricum TaxID=29372 RepID=UPI0018AA3A80|nr:hypothetical protein [Clostridium thermobutyricum]
MSPYYKYKKESLNKKFNTAKDTLALMQGAMKEYEKTNSIYIKRGIIGYYQDFTEYIIEMCETYLAMTDNYEDGLSGLQIIKKANIYGFIDFELEKYLLVIVKLRNRYTHDYYKRERVEEDIFSFCFKKMDTLKLFLQITNEKIKMDYEL